MSGKIPQLKRADFTLKKVKFADDHIIGSFVGTVDVDGKKETLEYDNVKGSYMPHEDLTHYQDELRPFLFKAFNLHVGFDLAEKYTTSGKKAKVVEERKRVMDLVEVRSVTIAGSDQLQGAKLSGVQESWNETNCITSAPTITYSSENLGFEKEVKKIVDLLEIEVYKYFFEGKTSERTLFDDGAGDGKVVDMNVNGAKEVGADGDKAVGQ